MERASVAGEACVKAARGMALALTAEVAVFGVLPAIVPPFCDEEPKAVITPLAEAGAASTAEDGVYLMEVVRALEPAEADAEDEKDVTAPAPLAPAEALD